jgi:tetratricopeptide (TPR) repeat protein
MRRVLLLACVIVAAPVFERCLADVLPASNPSAPSGMPPERQREILRDALNAFDDAVAVAHSDAARAHELYRSAASDFQALIDAGLRNAALEYNLGNTYFRLGRLGPAIVHYRRAELLDPGNETLRANLAYARRQVEPSIQAGGEERLLHRLLFWHYRTSLAQRFWAAALLSGAGWLLLIARLRWRSKPLCLIGLLTVVFGLAAGASALWQIRDEAQYPPAVVGGEECILRLGRGEGYDAALKQPLGPGVELRILQARGDWVEVELPNSQTGWLPAAGVERI